MKKMIIVIATTALITAFLTAFATFNYIVLNQEIEETQNGYEVTILNNVYFYE